MSSSAESDVASADKNQLELRSLAELSEPIVFYDARCVDRIEWGTSIALFPGISADSATVLLDRGPCCFPGPDKPRWLLISRPQGSVHILPLNPGSVAESPSDTQSLTRISQAFLSTAHGAIARLTKESPIIPQNQLHHSLMRRPTGDPWVWGITGQNVEGSLCLYPPTLGTYIYICSGQTGLCTSGLLSVGGRA